MASGWSLYATSRALYELCVIDRNRLLLCACAPVVITMNEGVAIYTRAHAGYPDQGNNRAVGDVAAGTAMAAPLFAT